MNILLSLFFSIKLHHTVTPNTSITSLQFKKCICDKVFYPFFFSVIFFSLLSHTLLLWTIQTYWIVKFFFSFYHHTFLHYNPVLVLCEVTVITARLMIGLPFRLRDLHTGSAPKLTSPPPYPGARRSAAAPLGLMGDSLTGKQREISQALDIWIFGRSGWEQQSEYCPKSKSKYQVQETRWTWFSRDGFWKRQKRTQMFFYCQILNSQIFIELWKYAEHMISLFLKSRMLTSCFVCQVVSSLCVVSGEGFSPEPSELNSLLHIDSRLQLLLPVKDFLSARSPPSDLGSSPVCTDLSWLLVKTPSVKAQEW